MKNLNTRQEIEYFHLQFLQFLPTVLDSSLFSVKGGCNLRFFFSSIRYSEDLDLDVQTVAVKTLEKNIDKLLISSAFVSALRAQRLELADCSKPKQTETTQRWKMQLLSKRTERKTNTKIEFSRRGLDSGVVVERVNQVVLDEYVLPRFSVAHYGRQRAFLQKLGALIGRVEPQARDVFDLDLLLSQKGELGFPETLDRTQKEAAIKTVLEISYADYFSKVVGYLKSEHQKVYSDPAIWGEIQLRVIEAIEGLAEKT